MKKAVLIIVLFCSVLIVEAQKNDQEEVKRLQQIEKEYDFLKQQQKEQLNFYQKEMENYRKYMETERGAHQAFLQNYLMIAGGIVSVLIFVLGWLGFKTVGDIKKNYKEKLEEQIEKYDKELNEQLSEKIADIIKRKPELVKNLIDNFETENLLKRSKSILVLGNTTDRNTNLVDLLKNGYKFSHITSAAENEFFVRGENGISFINENSKTNLNKFDLILLNNDNDNLTVDTRKFILLHNCIDNKVYLYYGQSRIENSELKVNVSSATMKSQIYGNIMNLLKYQEAIL